VPKKVATQRDKYNDTDSNRERLCVTHGGVKNNKFGEITNFLHAILQGDYKSNQISSRLAGHIPTKFH